LGRRWNVDPVVKEWQSTYVVFLNNPIYFTDPFGNDEPERKLAVKRAKEHYEKRTKYAYSSNVIPGGKGDCSGVISDCLFFAGYLNHRNNKGVPNGKNGYYNNGVALIVASSTEITYQQIEVGSIVTFRTARSDHQGPNGKYDHIGIVSNVSYENGKIINFDFIHISSKGVYEMNWDFRKGKSSWSLDQLKLTGVYKWDKEDGGTKKNSSGYSINESFLMSLIQSHIDKMSEPFFKYLSEYKKIINELDLNIWEKYNPIAKMPSIEARQINQQLQLEIIQ
jgi:hypothetical protein